MLELLLYYYAYNAWATEQTFAACEQLSPEEWTAPGCSGNGSICQTLDHAITVQWGWFNWYEESMDMKQSVGLMMTKDLDTLEKARARWAHVKAQTDRFLSQQTDESVGALRHFTRMNGAAEAQPLWKLLMHTSNHGTHTRAQIIAAIRRFGHNPGNIDLLNYVLNVKP